MGSLDLLDGLPCVCKCSTAEWIIMALDGVHVGALSQMTVDLFYRLPDP